MAQEVMLNLKDRFFEFCRQFPAVEDIDDLLKRSPVPTGIKIADFLFQGRTIVCEVKTLETETAEKLLHTCGKTVSTRLTSRPASTS